MAQDTWIRTLRGTRPAISALLAAYQSHPGAASARRVLAALDALERDALQAERRLMELLFADLDAARARIGGAGSAESESKTGENVCLSLPKSAHRGANRRN